MKRINFLIKLAKEGKLLEVEPSDEIKKAYLQRSNESLSSSKALLKIGNLKETWPAAMTGALLQLTFVRNITGKIH